MVLGALQFLGNLFEYFLTRKNEGKVGKGEFVQSSRRPCIGLYMVGLTLPKTGIISQSSARPAVM